MPTSYTYPIEQGCSFEEFVWRCARNFGALIDLRDAPDDAEVKEIAVDDCYLKALDEVEAELMRLDKMTMAELRLKLAAEVSEITRENAKRAEELKIKMERYATIRAQVEAWVPPTPAHEGMKEFMLEQIDLSTKGELPYQKPMPDADPAAWVENRRGQLLTRADYYRKICAEEKERVRKRNEWVNALRASLSQSKKEK